MGLIRCPDGTGCPADHATGAIIWARPSRNAATLQVPRRPQAMAQGARWALLKAPRAAHRAPADHARRRPGPFHGELELASVHLGIRPLGRVPSVRLGRACMAIERLKHHPLLNRRWVRTLVYEAKRRRRHFFERLGSDRYSQPGLDGLDLEVAARLPVTGGTFVEAGAYDGYWQSNTYWLERFRDWRGVLIEPIPELAQRARRERPRAQLFECALVAPDYGDKTVTLRFAGTMSLVLGARGDHEKEAEHVTQGATISRRTPYDVVVPARPLSAVLDEARLGTIDLLSLDVEGYEVEVLQGLDFTRHTPRNILVEMLDEGRQRPAIERLLAGRYAYVGRLSHRDHLYTLRWGSRLS